MKTSRSKIAQLVADKTLASGTSPKFAEEIAAYLLAEGRAGELDSLLRDVQELWTQRGYVEVLARTAHGLSEAESSEIKQQVTALYPSAEKVVVTEIIDPEVVGGVRLSLANQQLDLSVEAKINKFKQLTAAGKEN